MDNFAEQLVKRENTGEEKRRKNLTIFLGVVSTVILTLFSLLTFFASPIIALVCILLAVGSGCGTYFGIQGLQVEYEYTFTNGELDIDKIIAKKTRKEMVSVEVRRFTAFGIYTDSIEETDDMTVVIASSNIASQEYYADFPHDEYGSTRLIFCPDERMLENINKALPRALRTR